MPNFGRTKQTMEKCKQYFKKAKEGISQLQLSLRYFSSEEQKSQANMHKYD